MSLLPVIIKETQLEGMLNLFSLTPTAKVKLCAVILTPISAELPALRRNSFPNLSLHSLPVKHSLYRIPNYFRH
jgi:hypothetical protein